MTAGMMALPVTAASMGAVRPTLWQRLRIHSASQLPLMESSFTLQRLPAHLHLKNNYCQS